MNILVLAVSASLADPVGTSPLVSAAEWIQATLLGTVATIVAVIAVAAIGFLMLSGRLHVRRAATVLLGCFILFGATSITVGINAIAYAAQERGEMTSSEYRPVASQQTPSVSRPPATPSKYDPYAGASLHM